jgi:hypothetical protein
VNRKAVFSPQSITIALASSSRAQKAREPKKPKEKESESAMTEEILTATDYEVPSPGQYRVRIEEVKKRDGKFGPYYRISTKVVDDKHEGLWVSFVASAKLTPAAKLRIAAEDILDKRLKKGEKFNPQTLVGCEAIAEVSNKTEDERTYANIEQFFTLRDSESSAEAGDLRQKQEAAAEAKETHNTRVDEGYVEDEEEPLPDYNDNDAA